jgi:erythromycin esterase-like protein
MEAIMAQAQVVKFLGKITPEDHGGQARTVIFTLGNGSKLTACLDSYSAEMIERLAVHGLSQKIGDSASGFAKERDFLGAFGSMQQVEDNLKQGLWASRSGGGTSDLVAAIAKIKGVSLEDAQAAVDKATEEQVATLKKHPAIKEAIAKIQAARAKEAAKGAGSLDELVKGLGL